MQIEVRRRGFLVHEWRLVPDGAEEREIVDRLGGKPSRDEFSWQWPVGRRGAINRAKRAWRFAQWQAKSSTDFGAVEVVELPSEP